MQDIPNTVSFKALDALFKAATPETPALDETQGSASFEWKERIKAVLKELEQSSSQAAAGKSTDQIMAMGSFRTHLMLSLQALKAADL
ncbi:MAG: hypothetical protein AB8B36_13220 [Prochlorococcus sp.]